ncbi:GTPase IMAP family member 5-like [Chanodichthys erythropterus]|uniref:GTPase IMAP family member 5-like n=1 Tax=Chanodichthys erythropterus TaxID=933992 RepID=UPI00351E5C5D
MNCLTGDSQDLRIVLLGVSGAGKSSIGNAILGREAFKVSGTRESEIQGGRVEDRNISIIDTPGFFNTQLTDEEMKKQMMKSLDLSDPGPHVFLLVINVENFEQDKRNIVEKIQENFGAQALKFTMPLLTGGEKMSKKEWVTFKFSVKFRDLVNYCRNNYHVFKSKLTDPNNITNLLDKINKIKQNYDQHYKEIYFKCQIKSRKEKKKQEEENYREKEQAKHKTKIIQEMNKMPKFMENSTTNFLTERKNFISHETEKNVKTQDRVPQENKSNE